ncbi:hypothetical protein HJC23_006040 [Cyclotella cryptica]|uniref:Pseudouridine synthase I TruA alpha/beta domain-containing protein n=1 Tax=Cyclotella cryptica TaxID=29204 RepID=A0ABD3PVF7_9STRA|eukprot:CCRYP_011320-RA/>CCRYP_011320-RA protein AED:0.00 eAED:0.00 QI:185/-1/1/1/-1/1/1/141/530
MKFQQQVVTRWLALRFMLGFLLSSTIIELSFFDGLAALPCARAFSCISSMPGFRGRSQLGEQNTNPSEAVMLDHVRDLNSSNDIDDIASRDFSSNVILTTAVLKIAYDGTYFRGWTGDKQPKSAKQDSTLLSKPKQKQSRRSRNLQRKGSGYRKESNNTRTVENTLRISLAKLYGNVSPNDIVFDSCSRTDAGVHATSLIAQFYCFSRNREDSDVAVDSNVTWAQLRPGSPTDCNFLPLPFDSNLPKLVFVLNRMLPPDVRVIAASPAPIIPGCTPVKGVQDPVFNGGITQYNTMNKHVQPFHPTLHVKSKTYRYQFAVGPIQDPMRSQHIWHLDGSSNRAVGMNGRKFCFERALEAANVFVETIQPRDYTVFRSAFRGSDRGRIQSSICTLWRCDLFRESAEILPSWEMGTNVKHGSRLSDMGTVQSMRSCLGSKHYSATNVGTFTVVITGDRFLYKMIRHIVGTIVAVACGHLEVSDIRQALGGGENVTSMQADTNDFGMRRICAPARGLALCSVEYQDNIAFDWQTG